MHIDGSGLDDVEAVGRVALAEEVLAGVDRFHERDLGDMLDILRRQPGKKLAASEGFDDGALSERGE